MKKGRKKKELTPCQLGNHKPVVISTVNTTFCSVCKKIIQYSPKISLDVSKEIV